MPNGELKSTNQAITSNEKLQEAKLDQPNVEGTNQAITPNEKLQEANVEEAVPKVAFWKQAILPLIPGATIFICGAILGWTAKRKSDRIN